MGFNDAIRETIAALEDGRFQHEERPQAEGKNLLASGGVSVAEVVSLLRRCRGDQHNVTPHHYDPDQPVHVFKPKRGQERWYIKSYLLECDGVEAVFISVHPSESQ